MDVVSLTRKLVSFNTVNPPGNEEDIARFAGNLLSDHGFSVEYLPYAKNRVQLVAEKGVGPLSRPLVFTGHFDTVPPGNMPWKKDPFTGGVYDKRIWGLGTSDMKGALASIMIAAIEAGKGKTLSNGIRLIFTADEEPGCRGALQYARSFRGSQKAGAIIVGEPTSNLPVTAHKGAIYLKAEYRGKTAHSSMPEKGINAVYKAAGAVCRLSQLDFGTEADPLLGYPTLNIGKFTGGRNINSVPDHAEFTIDIRTTSGKDHGKILELVKNTLGKDAAVEKLVDIEPLHTASEDPFIRLVYDICGVDPGNPDFPMALPYLTDGAVLQQFYNNAPTVILGPGEPEQAHRADEHCHLEKLTESVGIYKEIISQWNG